MEKTTNVQMKRLLRKAQALQLYYFGKVAGLSLEINTRKDGECDAYICVTVFYRAEPKFFNFYPFLAFEDNEAQLEDMTKLIRSLKS